MTTKNSLNDELSVPSAMIIGNIAKVRNQKGYTQAYMAYQLGITERAYQKIEQGKNKSITVDMTNKIAQALEINWTDLLINPENKIQQTLNANNNSNNNHNINYATDSALSHELEKQKIHLAAKDEKIADLEVRIADFTERIAELKQMNQVLMSNAK